MNCIVTKIDGHRLCMVEHHVPSNTRYTTETCEFIRVLGNVKIGDQIIIDADEWKGYPAKCYKSPGCGKVIVKKQGSNAGGNAASYTKLEDICRDGKKSIGKVAEIGGLFLVDCFPEAIQFHTNQKCVTTLELKHSPAVYEKLKPYEFKRNLKVRFRIAQTYIENNHIKGEFIAIASEDGQPAAGAPASQQAASPQGPAAQGSSASGNMGWRYVGKGDCTGRDVQPLSLGSPVPRADLCNASFLDKTAVCWDGSTMKHWGSDKPQCTYKDVAPEGCTGGGTPGYIYRCAQRGVENSGTPPSYSTSQQVPGAMENIVQEGLQKGVQKGLETLKGIFR
ncbi:MAG: hypothetical protein KBG09_03185 [Syntrophobacterales bacterium]|nr:hypothetical protein [Syntrophobacterales bacterium]